MPKEDGKKQESASCISWYILIYFNYIVRSGYERKDENKEFHDIRSSGSIFNNWKRDGT